MFWMPAFTEGDIRSIFLLNEMDEKFKFNEDDLFTLDLCDVNPKQLILEFKEKYGKYISYYIEKFGPLDVKFGVVNYSS